MSEHFDSLPSEPSKLAGETRSGGKNEWMAPRVRDLGDIVEETNNVFAAPGSDGALNAGS